VTVCAYPWLSISFTRVVLHQTAVTYVGHDLLSQVRIGVLPRRTILNYVVRSGRSQLTHHQRRRRGRDNDGAQQVQSTGRVDGCETSIAAAGREDVGLRTIRELFETAKYVVTDTSGGLSVCKRAIIRRFGMWILP
jgi:hypothetical protein